MTERVRIYMRVEGEKEILIGGVTTDEEVPALLWRLALLWRGRHLSRDYGPSTKLTVVDSPQQQ
jgi:hypothetical protein